MNDIVPYFSGKDEPLFKSAKEIIKDGDKAIKNTLRKELNDRLLDCTETQRDFFYKVFTGTINSFSREKLIIAVDLVHRTIVKNLKEEQIDCGLIPGSITDKPLP